MNIKNLINEHPFLKNIEKFSIIESSTTINEMANGQKIKAYDNYISVLFLQNCLQKEEYFNKLLKYLTGENDKFNVFSLVNGDIGKQIGYRKSTIVKALETYQKEFDCSIEDKKKIDYFKKILGIEKFIEKNKNNLYKISIDGAEYTFLLKDFFDILSLNDEEFNNLSCKEEYNNHKIKHLFYAFNNYIYSNNILDSFILDDNIVDRIYDINSSKIIDITALNKLYETKDTLYSKVNLNKELQKHILEGISEDFNLLEKTIYIYTKMCKTFIYDDKYYAADYFERQESIHSDIKNIDNISLTNNKIVCFEFSMIFSKLLNELGINFHINYRGEVEENYGYGHSELQYRVGDMLIYADAVYSILYGDMFYAKMNKRLSGLLCLGNTSSFEEFNKSFEKVTSHFEKLEEISFDKAVSEYKKMTTKMTDVSFEIKKNILIDYINLKEFKGMEVFSNTLTTKKWLFNDHEKKHNLGICLIKDNSVSNDMMVKMIITFNNDDINNINTNEYYCSDEEIKKIKLDELQNKFDDNIFEFMEDKDNYIPGLKGKVRK